MTRGGFKRRNGQPVRDGRYLAVLCGCPECEAGRACRAPTEEVRRLLAKTARGRELLASGVVPEEA